MALLSYFKVLPPDLPDPSGPLLSELPSAAITEASSRKTRLNLSDKGAILEAR